MAQWRNSRIYGIVAMAVLAVIAGVGLVYLFTQHGKTAGAPASISTPSPVPVNEPQKTPGECSLTFVGESIGDSPAVRREGDLFGELPTPHRAERVFAGWYDTAEAAARFDATHRIGAADTVSCPDRQRTLYGAWKDPQDVAAENIHVPILMYHQFTTRPEGEDHELRENYSFIGDFDAQIGYLAEQQYYFPTWQELNAFIDGSLYLPPHSVIVTDDDADKTWLELAVPVLDKHQVPATSFVITQWRSEPTPSKYVVQRSHTHAMHDYGANGQGLMVNLPADQVVADLRESTKILGASEVFAYPFGHFNETAEAAVRDAGFQLAVTTQDDYAAAGMNKLELPRIRINYGLALPDFIAVVQ